MTRFLVLAALLASSLAHAKGTKARPMSADQVLAADAMALPLRTDQEELLKRLLAETPASMVDDRAQYTFMLGELYARQQRTFRLQAAEAEIAGDAKKAEKATATAKDYLVKAVIAYRDLTENQAFQNFAQMDLALFLYAYTLQSGKYLTEARAVFEKLLKNYPSSKYVVEAHLAIGEHFFEAGKLAEAADRYKRVLEFPKSSVYWYARYKLGWIQLNRSQFDDALETFYQVAQGTEHLAKQALLHRSAKQDFVRAYAEVGKVDKAYVAFKRVDGKAPLALLDKLADVLVEQGKSDKAIYTLRELMKLAPTSPSVCHWQHEVATAMMTLPGASTADKVHEVQDLARIYQAIASKKVIPADKVRDCQEAAAGMVADLARTYHNEWSKTKNADLLDASAKLYGTYLATFPKADDFARTRYFYAELLWSRAEGEPNARLRVENWEAAARAFTAVVKGGGLEPKLINEASYASVRAWMFALEVGEQRLKPPPDPDLVGDAPPKPQPVPEREQSLLDAIALYLGSVKAPDEDELVHIKLVRANVLRRYDHLDEAIPMFRDLLAKHPKHELAERAARLLLDSLVRKHDEKALVATTDQFLAEKRFADDPELQEYLEKVKTTSLRLAAERIEKTARAGHDLEGLVRSGLAYLDIYNRKPLDDKNDEVLYNAGVCFEDGRSLEAAKRVYLLLERFYPKSPLAQSAMARLGRVYADVAHYDLAAAKLEQYARKYGGEANAFDALNDAVFFYKGIGDDAKAIEDTLYLIAQYRTKKPAEAANAAFSLTAIYEKQGNADALAKHLRWYIRDHGAAGGTARLAIAHARLGELLLHQSCPVREVDGACIKIKRERAVALRKRTHGATQCGPDSTASITTIGRDARAVRDGRRELAAAASEFAKVPRSSPEFATARHQLAEGRLAEAAVAYEEYVALAFPTNLDFDPKKPDVAKRSLERFNAWFTKKEAGAKRASEAQTAVLSLQDSAASIGAAARLGQITQHFADSLFTAEIPRDVRTGPYAEDKVEAYCDVLTDKAEPLASRSLDAYGSCLAKSTELGWFSEWSRLCERELGQIKPEAYPTASERRGESDRAALVIALEKPAGLDD